MTKLSAEDILKLARLARLELTDEEITQFSAEISAILGYVEQLKDVDLSSYPATSQVTGLENVTRPDAPLDYIAKPDDLLRNAPAVQAGQIKVKRMIG